MFTFDAIKLEVRSTPTPWTKGLGKLSMMNLKRRIYCKRSYRYATTDIVTISVLVVGPVHICEYYGVAN
jgi:hypothetical protein